MFRFTVAFCLISLLLYSVGCQVPRFANDDRVPAFIDRHSDYRGFGAAHYRAGSVLRDEVCMPYMAGNLFNNAGNFGVTTPVILEHRNVVPGLFEADPTLAPPLRPRDDHRWDERNVDSPWAGDTNGYTSDRDVPTFPDLFDIQRDRAPIDIVPAPGPLIPPALPERTPPLPLNIPLPVTVPLPFNGAPVDVVPFSPSDGAPAQPIPNPLPVFIDSDPPITLEELQRLDPSVQNLEIISIEDAAVRQPRF